MSSMNINAIKARYKASFGEKKAIVDDYRDKLFNSSSEDLPVLYEQIHADLHKLAGSLGMYGYDQLAEQARLGMSFALAQDHSSLDESLINLSLLFIEKS